MAEPSGAPLPIVCTGAAVAHGGTQVLAGVDLTVRAGDCIFVLGPNGAGKSTLLRLLHGLVPPAAGRVEWSGSPRPQPGQAMVFQRAVLLRRSAAANLRYALRLAGIAGRAADERIAQALHAVGLAHLAYRSARVLSGGEQQRLALARAWALRPAVLFLDEPTASLDPKATRAVEDIVRGIHAQGTTIVMSTHNLAQARRMARDIVFLAEGRVVERSPADVFFATPRTSEAAAFLEGERL